MDQEKRTYIESALKAGKQRDEIRRGLISEGIGSSGFDEMYSAVCQELGIKEVVQAASVVPNMAFNKTPANGDLPSVLTCLKFSLQLILGNLNLIFAALTLVIIGLSLSLFVPTEPTLYLYGTPYLLLVIVTKLLGSLLSWFAILALLYSLVMVDERVSYLQSLSWVFGRFSSILWVTILLSAVTISGFALLIIPGLIFIIYALFSYFALVDEDQRGMDAVLRSADLVSGKFWGIAVHVLVLSLLIVPLVWLFSLIEVASFVPTDFLLLGGVLEDLLTSVGWIFSSAFTIGYLSHLYRSQVTYKNFFDKTAYKSIQFILWALFLIGLVLPTLAIYLGIWQPEIMSKKFDVDYRGGDGGFTTTINQNDENFDDFLIENRVNTAFNASSIYFSKIRTYEGVCNDVVFETPAKCLSTDTTFVTYAPLSEGRYYCRDSSGYKGYQYEKPVDAQSCQ